MKLATVSLNGLSSAVVVLNSGSLLNIAHAATTTTYPGAEFLKCGSMQKIISGGSLAIQALYDLVTKAEAGVLTQYVHAVGESELMAPIPVPKKNIFCVGRNYAEHIAEGEKAQNVKIGVTEHPVFFTKPPTSIVSPGDDVLIFSSISEAIDYEVELAVVIGKPGRNIAKTDAYNHIFGYTILNDITARDIQRRHGGQYFKGKGLDGSCPVGPWIVTADEISNPSNLSIGLTVNGEKRQDGNTSDMIFDIPTIIASLSEGMTLEAGDIIATGTPSGVGYAMEPPVFLKSGDTVVCNVSEIGTLTNTVRTV
ncbi:fumarylacetoacetate hydrolase family protein [Paracoccaceae bacterium]|nr:fumarylacetoacetate hydrolase family protein [Paracoccaceae bacterium]